MDLSVIPSIYFFSLSSLLFVSPLIWDFPVCCPGSVRCVKLIPFLWDGNTGPFLHVLLHPLTLLRRAVSFLKWSAASVLSHPHLSFLSRTTTSHTAASSSYTSLLCFGCITYVYHWSKSQMRLDVFCAKSELMCAQAMVYAMCWSKLPRKHSGEVHLVFSVYIM